MGLDSIELVMEVEKTFGVSVPNKVWEQAKTVGDMQEIIWKYIQHRPNAHCRSQQMFYRLRNLFKDHYNFPKQEISTGLNPNEIFPKLQRRQRYLHFSETSGLRLPPLQLSETMAYILFIAGFILIAGSLAAAYVLATFYDLSNWLYMTPVLGAIITGLISDALTPFRKYIPQLTLRDFTFKVLALNYPQVEKQHGNSRADVNELVRVIVADRAGVELEEVTPDKSFTRDLGMD